MNTTKAHSAAPGDARKIKWIVAGLLAVLVVIVTINLPRGYSDDLSLIGKGKPAVVLVRDKNSVESQKLMEVLDAIRGHYAGRVQFLLTDFGTPQGNAFVAANQAASTTLVLFDATGKRVNVLTYPQTEASVKQALAAIPAIVLPKTSGRILL